MSDAGSIGQGILLTTVALLILQVAGLFFIFLMWNRMAPASEAGSAVLAISMTAIQVMLGVLAIIIGLGAFFGFWMVRDAAVSAARKEARQAIEEMGSTLFDEAKQTRGQEIKPEEKQKAKFTVNSKIEAAIKSEAKEVTADEDDPTET